MAFMYSNWWKYAKNNENRPEMDALLKSHFENFQFFLSVSRKNILSSEIFVIFAGLPA